MIELPDEINYNIFSYLFKNKYLIFFKNIKLQISDYTTICNTLYDKLQTLKQFVTKTPFWRIKNHTINLNISADPLPGYMGVKTIYELKFTEPYKHIRMMNNHFSWVSNDIRSEEFITDNFKKSNKVLQYIKNN